MVCDVDKPKLVSEQWHKHLKAAPYQSTRPDTPGRAHYMFAMPPGRGIGNPEFPGGEMRGLDRIIIVANSSTETAANTACNAQGCCRCCPTRSPIRSATRHPVWTPPPISR